MKGRMRVRVTALLLVPLVASVSTPVTLAASRQELERDAAKAPKTLYANNSIEQLLGKKATAVLDWSRIHQ